MMPPTSSETGTPAAKLDGAQLAILDKRFEGVVKRMANTLLRTGRSGVLNRARDFSCCIVTRDCELLTAAMSLPIHVLSGPDMMARAVHEFHPRLRRGDAFLNNSPYHGCSHAADLTLLAPVVDEDGEHHFTVVAKAHQADIGNSIPTTYHAAARDVYEEGPLLFPAVKVQEDYASIGDIVRMCKMRIRVPGQWHGDYLAMVGAVRVGEDEILTLAREYGWNLLHSFTHQWFDYSEARMALALQQLQGGSASGTSIHDPLPGVVEHEIPVTARVSVDAKNSRVAIDLRENPDCLPCGLNVSEACARTSALIGVFNSIDSYVPKNAGSFRRVSIDLRKGCIVGIPEHPFSCSAATTNVADRITNAVQLAMANLNNRFGMAEIGAGLPPARGVFSGVDPRSGMPFINQVFLGSSGGGGSRLADGWFQNSHAGNGGMAYLDSVELAEHYQPIVVHARRFLPDSEGAGRNRGAPSKLVEFGPTHCVLRVAYASDGGVHPPKGVRGGLSGGGSQQLRRGPDGRMEPLRPCGVVELSPGETIVSRTCGGGGYGVPGEREPHRVAHDVKEGWITVERASRVYCVAVDQDGVVDRAATNALRSKRQTEHPGDQLEET